MSGNAKWTLMQIPAWLEQSSLLVNSMALRARFFRFQMIMNLQRIMVILYFHQVLWYGKRLNQSLLNPNQLRHYGRSVCDNVTDKSRSFGISIDDEFVIPFTMMGTNIFFESRVPTKWEMENC
jgi:hypothetical protein